MSKHTQLARISAFFIASAIAAVTGPGMVASATPLTAHVGDRTTQANPAPGRAVGSDLSIIAAAADTADGPLILRVLIANLGPEATTSPFQVTISLPYGASTAGAVFPTGCTTTTQGRLTRCSFPAGLGSLQTATVLVPVAIHRHTAPQPGMVVVSSPEQDTNGQRFTFFTLPAP